MKKTLILLLIPAAVSAQECVLQDRTVTKTSAVIAERSQIRRDVVATATGKKCLVDFRARVGVNWHTAFGEYNWSGDRPENEACAIAVSRADDSVRERVGKNQTTNEKTLVCKDQPKLSVLSSTQVGTVGDVGQFRPHPEYPKRFYHNGTECKWFVESNFVARDIRTYQGVICQIREGKWVVTDKF